MTELELESRMKQIINDYAPILDAKPIEEIKAELKSLPKTKGKGLRTLKKVASIPTPATSSEEPKSENKNK